MAASLAFKHFENKLSAEYILGNWINNTFVPQSSEAALNSCLQQEDLTIPSKEGALLPKAGKFLLGLKLVVCVAKLLA